MGIDKLVPTIGDALKTLKVLTRNATAQQITSYVTWVTGSNECAAAADNKKEVHFVMLDNGRREMAKDPLFSQVFRCVRCGACANVCPVYRLVGGHKMGHIYIGAIGLILTYFFHGTDKAKNLVQNCINCEACKDICAGGIDLPRLNQGSAHQDSGRGRPSAAKPAARQNPQKQEALPYPAAHRQVGAETGCRQ